MKLGSRLFATVSAFALAASPAFAAPASSGGTAPGVQPGGAVDTNTVNGITNSARAAFEVSVTETRFAGGAKGDGGTNDLAAISAAAQFVNSRGGGVVYLPTSTAGYYINLSAGSLPAYSNVVYKGSGVGFTKLICDDTQGGSPGSCILNQTGGAISDFWVRGITFQGMNQVNPNNGKGFAYITACTSCGIEDSEGLYSRGMSFRFQSSDKIRITRDRILKSNSDCIAVWDTPNALITQNTISGCSDDAISTHSQDTAAAPVRSGIIVTDNLIEESQGIKSLGAKIYVASHNVLRRIMGVGIYVDAQASYAQGDTAIMAVSLDENIITDVFQRQDGSGNQAQAYIIVSGGPKQVVIPALGAADTSGLLYANGTNSATTSPGGSWLSVSRNSLLRTLPAVTAYANWGYSPGLWDGQTGAASGGMYTGAIPEAALNTRAIQINGPMRAARIEGNTIDTTSTCLYFAASTPKDLDYDGVFFTKNTCLDHGNNGVSQAAAAVSNQRVFIEDNAFDGDPRFVHSNRGTNGTWLADSFPYGASLPFFNGVRLARNSFRNEADPVNQGSAIWSVGEGNMQFGNPIGTNNGFSTSNVGIGAFKLTGWDSTQQDENPNSATYGTTLAASLLNRAYNILTASSFTLGSSSNANNQYGKVNGAGTAERGIEMQTAGVSTWRLITNSSGQLVVVRLNNNGTYGTYVDSPLVFRTDGSVSTVNKWAFAGSIRLGSGVGLTATGTTLATALALTADLNEVTTVSSGTGVSLAAYNATLGGTQRQEVISAGANALNVYPPVSTAAIRNLNGSASAGAAGAAVSLAVGTHATFECVSATLCYEAP